MEATVNGVIRNERNMTSNPDDLLVIPDWAEYLPYVRLSRDRLRSRLPSVSLNVSEVLDVLDALDLLETGAFLRLLLEYASCPLMPGEADALGMRKLSRGRALRLLRTSDGGANRKRNASALLDRLEQVGCVAFCPANDGHLSSGVVQSRGSAGLSSVELGSAGLGSAGLGSAGDPDRPNLQPEVRAAHPDDLDPLSGSPERSTPPRSFNELERLLDAGDSSSFTPEEWALFCSS